MFYFKPKGLTNIWLESCCMIHFALFSFQGTTWFFNRRSLEATCLLYLVSFEVSSTFLNFFFQPFSLPIKALRLKKFKLSCLALSVSDLYYDTLT